MSRFFNACMHITKINLLWCIYRIELDKYNTIRRASQSLRDLSHKRDTLLLSSRSGSLSYSDSERFRRGIRGGRDTSYSAPSTLQRWVPVYVGLCRTPTQRGSGEGPGAGVTQAIQLPAHFRGGYPYMWVSVVLRLGKVQVRDQGRAWHKLFSSQHTSEVGTRICGSLSYSDSERFRWGTRGGRDTSYSAPSTLQRLLDCKRILAYSWSVHPSIHPFIWR